MVVDPGMKIPTDGVILQGESSLDVMAAIATEPAWAQAGALRPWDVFAPWADLIAGSKGLSGRNIDYLRDQQPATVEVTLAERS